MVDPIIGPAIQFIGLLLNWGSQAVTIEHNQRMFEETQKYNEKMQDKQNLYNSPVEQAKRWTEAGYNPGSFMSSYPSASVSPTPIIPVKAIDFNLDPFVDSLMNMNNEEIDEIKRQIMEDEVTRKEFTELLEDEQSRLELEKLQQELENLQTTGEIKKEQLKDLLEGFFEGKNIGDKLMMLLTKLLSAMVGRDYN